MTNQNSLTLITPVHPDKKATLFTFLANLKIDLEDDIPESFETIGTIHYARWVVIDYEIEKGQSSLGDMPKLVYSANFDGTAAQHILDLCSHAANVLDKIYVCCDGYPSSQERTTENRVTYLSQWITPVSAFYKGSPGRTLKQILQENKLRLFIRDFLDKKNWENHPAKEIQEEILQAVNNESSFIWTKEKIQLPKINWWRMILLAIVLLALLPFIILWVLFIQFKYERHDPYFTLKRSQLDREQMKKLEEYEDLEMQNQFSQLVVMKPGKVRLLTFKAMMLFARYLISIVFVEGKLMGIPSIHFARWVLFDNNKRVLFFSNFDGSWQQYLGDFIDKSGWGLTGIFSNTTNFPKTKFLITGGAYDEEHFLAWSRSTEIQTQIWYNAYPHLSIKNVNNNSKIRKLLFSNLSEKEAGAFLKLI